MGGTEPCDRVAEIQFKERSSQSVNTPLTLHQWFLTGVASIHFQGAARSHAPYYVESLIIKFTNKYVCIHNLFKVRGA